MAGKEILLVGKVLVGHAMDLGFSLYAGGS